MRTMSGYFTALVSVGFLSQLVLADGAIECSEEESPLRPISSTVPKVTRCLMECTGMTYILKLQLEDQRNIRLTDATEGELGEYCWSTEIKCIKGESFERAYAVLPVDLSAVGPDRLEVTATAPGATTLRAHSGRSTVADDCGLRYDVTEHFSTATAGTSFCIRVMTPEDVLGDTVLKCPPLLVTFWQRSPNYPNQRAGG